MSPLLGLRWSLGRAFHQQVAKSLGNCFAAQHYTNFHCSECCAIHQTGSYRSGALKHPHRDRVLRRATPDTTARSVNSARVGPTTVTSHRPNHWPLPPLHPLPKCGQPTSCRLSGAAGNTRTRRSHWCDTRAHTHTHPSAAPRDPSRTPTSAPSPAGRSTRPPQPPGPPLHLPPIVPHPPSLHQQPPPPPPPLLWTMVPSL